MTDSNPDRAIGRLEGRVDGLDKKLDEIKTLLERQNEASGESRKALYARVGKIETSIEIGGQIDAQVRDRIDALESRITQDVMPTINELTRWKVAGVTVITMAGFAGASIAAFLIWAWDTIVSKWNGAP